MGLISLSAKINAFLYFGLNQNLDQLLKFLIIQMKCTTVIQCVKTFIFDVL